VALASATTTTLANMAVDAMNKVVAAQMSHLQFWRWFEQIAMPIPNDGSVQTMKFITWGGVGNLPTVSEGAAYTELTVDDEKVAKVTRAVTRQARMFATPTRVNFSPSKSENQTVFELITADRPGLLSNVGQVFTEQGINITSAKIMTIGERAEDVFYISDLAGRALTESALDNLADSLRDKLEQKQT
jgi:hypothetical protein